MSATVEVMGVTVPKPRTIVESILNRMKAATAMVDPDDTKNRLVTKQPVMEGATIRNENMAKMTIEPAPRKGAETLMAGGEAPAANAGTVGPAPDAQVSSSKMGVKGFLIIGGLILTAVVIFGGGRAAS